jgi:hypothetical protein
MEVELHREARTVKGKGRLQRRRGPCFRLACGFREGEATWWSWLIRFFFYVKSHFVSLLFDFGTRSFLCFLGGIFPRCMDCSI